MLAHLLLTGAASATAGDPLPPAPLESPHATQQRELGAALDEVTDDGLEALLQPPFPRTQAPTVARPHLDPRFIVFGYLQSESQVFHLRWPSLSHIGSRFVGFDAAGHLTGAAAFTSRSAYLQAGGAAEAAGVKVILVVNNFDDSPGGVLETVMTDPQRRATLVGDIVGLLASDAYSHGVNMDLEFSWGPAVRDGITAFMAELRTALDATDPAAELSIYTNAIFSANQWDLDAQTGITPHIDYLLYSMYDWATGLTVHAISDFDNCLGASRLHGYLNAGLPPEKLVLTMSAYSRQWNSASTYNGMGTSASSSGFTDALYDVTLNPLAGGPHVNTAVSGDEASWYTWNDGLARTRCWEGLDGIEYKLRHVLSLQDPAGTFSGRRIGGIGFWSLLWMAETSSFDPRTGQSVGRTRTYPHIYQRCQEILAVPGEESRLLESFAGLDFRWRDPNESPDTSGDPDADSSRALVAAPAGPGAPPAATLALQWLVDLEGAGSNQAVLAHEILASNLAPGVADRNAALAHFDGNNKLEAAVHVNPPLPGYQLQMLVVDSLGQLEASPPLPLTQAGWHTFEWDLTDASAPQPYGTAEPALSSGDGVLDGAASGQLGLYGFVVKGSGPASSALTIDELRVRRATPGGRHYVINEFRYAVDDQEFIEIHGPAGPFPAGLELRVYAGADGTVASSFALGTAAITDSGNGSGLFVLGDPAVPGVQLTTGFGPTSQILDANPSGLQLFDPQTGCTYDSVVYEAFGGLADLTRPATRRVTDHGFPWLGEVAPGTDASGVAYTMGRFPDGADRRINARDFSFMPASPGSANGNSLVPETRLDFETPPPSAFQTYGSLTIADPVSVGLPTSPTGGLAYRCVDPAGGGVIGVFGDAALGAQSGYEVSGDLYLPAMNEPAQAVAVGICGSQGSTFFTSSQAALHRSAYESGYWLIYENRPGVALANGRPDHPGRFEFVHVTHDHQDGEVSQVLGSIPAAQAGAAAGAWTRFRLRIDPDGPTPSQLTVLVGGTTVHRGPLPAGGPRQGAIQIGFRENHPGPPSSAEGTWIDALHVRPVPSPLRFHQALLEPLGL